MSNGKLERFTEEVQQILPPLVAGQVFHLIETAAYRGINGSAYGLVQTLPELGQHALACEGLRALVDEINGGSGTRAPDTPLEALQRQLVTDEITEEEFLAKRAELLSAGKTDPGEESRQREDHKARTNRFAERQMEQMERFDAQHNRTEAA